MLTQKLASLTQNQTIHFDNALSEFASDMLKTTSYHPCKEPFFFKPKICLDFLKINIKLATSIK